jgi:hypothetical protein
MLSAQRQPLLLDHTRRILDSVALSFILRQLLL